jgi:hypothetical protein
MLRTKVLRKIKAFILFPIFIRKSCRLRDNVEKYGRARQAADDYKQNACAVHAG